LFDASGKTLHIADYAGGQLKDHITATTETGRRIVFRNSKRADLLKPAVPPRWWRESPE